MKFLSCLTAPEPVVVVVVVEVAVLNFSLLQAKLEQPVHRKTRKFITLHPIRFLLAFDKADMNWDPNIVSSIVAAPLLWKQENVAEVDQTGTLYEE